MNCEAVREWIVAAIDTDPNGERDELLQQRMTVSDRAALEQHLAECEACARFREMQMFADQALAAEFANVVPDVALADRIRAAATEPLQSTTPHWLPDALNATGAMFTAGLLSTLDLSPAMSMTAVLATLTLIAIGGYPLLLLRRD
jgi:anti-sigma factor RsiW